MRIMKLLSNLSRAISRENILMRKPLIDKSQRGLSGILRMVEVQIIIILILIGLLTIHGKNSLGLNFNMPFEESIRNEINSPRMYRYSFQDASFGFDKSLVDLKLQIKEKRNFENNLLNSLPRNIRLKAKPFIKAILRVSEIYQVDPIWIASVIWTESHFDSKAKSHVGAHGLMQIMPTTRKYLYKKIKKKNGQLLVEKASFDLKEFFGEDDIEINKSHLIKSIVHIELGVFYLKGLLNRFKGNHKIATIAYNMGPTWTSRRISMDLPLGNKNHYLSKVKKAYAHISKSI